MAVPHPHVQPLLDDGEEDEVLLLAHLLDPLDAVAVHGQRDVDLALLEQLHRLLALLLVVLREDVGVLALEAHDRLEEDLAHGVHDVGLLHHQLDDVVGGDLPGSAQGVLVGVVDLDGVFQEGRAGRRQLQALAALEQVHSQLLLELQDVLAQVGLGSVEVGGGGGEVEVVRQDDVFVQRLYLHPVIPSLRPVRHPILASGIPGAPRRRTSEWHLCRLGMYTASNYAEIPRRLCRLG